MGWLFGFYGLSTFVDYLMPNLFYTKNQFYFKQFSLARVHSLIIKKHFYLKQYSIVSYNSNDSFSRKNSFDVENSSYK